MNRVTLDTPVGPLTLVEDAGFITALRWQAAQPQGESAVLREAIAQLNAYFAGKLQRFTLPLAAQSSGFAHGVCEAMLAIPYGETRTYGEIAKNLEVNAQAVGKACGANPIAILIPCHRVVSATSLGGYSGAGGVETKVALLKLEGAASLLL